MSETKNAHEGVIIFEAIPHPSTDSHRPVEFLAAGLVVSHRHRTKLRIQTARGTGVWVGGQLLIEGVWLERNCYLLFQIPRIQNIVTLSTEW